MPLLAAIHATTHNKSLLSSKCDHSIQDMFRPWKTEASKKAVKSTVISNIFIQKSSQVFVGLWSRGKNNPRRQWADWWVEAAVNQAGLLKWSQMNERPHYSNHNESSLAGLEQVGSSEMFSLHDITYLPIFKTHKLINRLVERLKINLQ